MPWQPAEPATSSFIAPYTSSTWQSGRCGSRLQAQRSFIKCSLRKTRHQHTSISCNYHQPKQSRVMRRTSAVSIAPVLAMLVVTLVPRARFESVSRAAEGLLGRRLSQAQNSSKIVVTSRAGAGAGSSEAHGTPHGAFLSMLYTILLQACIQFLWLVLREVRLRC